MVKHKLESQQIIISNLNSQQKLTIQQILILDESKKGNIGEMTTKLINGMMIELIRNDVNIILLNSNIKN